MKNSFYIRAAHKERGAFTERRSRGCPAPTRPGTRGCRCGPRTVTVFSMSYSVCVFLDVQVIFTGEWISAVNRVRRCCCAASAVRAHSASPRSAQHQAQELHLHHAGKANKSRALVKFAKIFFSLLHGCSQSPPNLPSTAHGSLAANCWSL